MKQENKTIGLIPCKHDKSSNALVYTIDCDAVLNALGLQVTDEAKPDALRTMIDMLDDKAVNRSGVDPWTPLIGKSDGTAWLIKALTEKEIKPTGGDKSNAAKLVASLPEGLSEKALTALGMTNGFDTPVSYDVEAVAIQFARRRVKENAEKERVEAERHANLQAILKGEG